MTNTRGTITRMKRSISQVNRAMPLSNAVCVGCSESDSAMPPK